MTVADTLSGVAAGMPDCKRQHASTHVPRAFAAADLRHGPFPKHACTGRSDPRRAPGLLFETEGVDFDLVNEAAIAWLTQHGIVSLGDRVILSKGDHRDVQGGTNTLKIMEVR